MILDTVLDEQEIKSLDKALSILVSLAGDKVIETDFFILRKDGNNLTINNKKLNTNELTRLILGDNYADTVDGDSTKG